VVNTACIQEIKAQKTPQYASVLVSIWLEDGFLFQAKNGSGHSPQTSSLTFIVGSSGALKLKNIEVGQSGSQEICISSFEKPCLCEQK